MIEYFNQIRDLHIIAALSSGTLFLLRGIAMWVGSGLGMVAPVRWVTEPVLNFLRSLPPLGYIGLLIVWFGIGDTSKIWLLFLAAFPPIAIATLDGVLGVKQDYLSAARALVTAGP